MQRIPARQQRSAGRETVVTMTNSSMPLNNDGNTVMLTVRLIDGSSVVRHQVSYTAENMKSGVPVAFAK